MATDGVAALPLKADTPRRLTCARCGEQFECSRSGECWCAAEPYRLAMPENGQDCLCPGCLKKAAAATR